MDQTANTAFSRTLAFTRSRSRNGLFNWPTTTFALKQSDREIGQLEIRWKKASYTAAASDSFSLKKSFWGTRWLYEGDGEREFGRAGFGWNFKPSFTFSDGSRYYLKARRRRPFGSKGDKPTLSASFSREDVEVMLLQSFKPAGFLFNEMTAALEGTISTNIADDHVIVGLLLFYQGLTEARHRSSH